MRREAKSDSDYVFLTSPASHSPLPSSPTLFIGDLSALPLQELEMLDSRVDVYVEESIIRPRENDFLNISPFSTLPAFLLLTFHLMIGTPAKFVVWPWPFAF